MRSGEGQGGSFPAATARFWIAPGVVFFVLLGLYLATLAPSVVGGDSGLLTTAALSGGVPHAPGYPLFSMLARLLAALPLGPSPAWRVNLLSAGSVAASAALLCAVVQLLTRNKAAALSAAALFGSNAVVWYHATAAEVFGPNAFFLSAACLLWLAVEQTHSRRLLFALTFVSGLAMCNQHTFLLFGLPLIVSALIATRRTFAFRDIAVALAFGLVGLLPYLYLPLASASSAAVSWGDQTSLSGFVDHLLRRSYGTFSLGQSATRSAVGESTFLPALGLFAINAFSRFAWIGTPLAIAGFALVRRADRDIRRWTVILAAVSALYVLLFCALCGLSPTADLYRTEILRFFIQADFVIALAAGFGVAGLLQWLKSRSPFLDRHRQLAYALPVLVLLLGVLANGKVANRRNNHIFTDFAKTALTSLPPNTILITVGDGISGAISYLHEVEGLRPDVVHLDRELLSFPWYCQRKRRLHPNIYLPEGTYRRGGWTAKDLLDGNSDRPLGVIPLLDPWDTSWTSKYMIAPLGLVSLLLPRDRFPSYEEWLAADQRAMGSYDVVPALRFRQGTWESALAQIVLTTQGVRAHRAFAYSLDRGSDLRPARRCISLLEDIIAKAGGEPILSIPGVPQLAELDVASSLWRNLGICYELVSREDPTYLPRVGAAIAKFAERASPDDPDLPAARKYIDLHRPQAGPR